MIQLIQPSGWLPIRSLQASYRTMQPNAGFLFGHTGQGKKTKVNSMRYLSSPRNLHVYTSIILDGLAAFTYKHSMRATEACIGANNQPSGLQGVQQWVLDVPPVVPRCHPSFSFVLDYRPKAIRTSCLLRNSIQPSARILALPHLLPYYQGCLHTPAFVYTTRSGKRSFSSSATVRKWS